MESCKLQLIVWSTGEWRKYYNGVTNINNSHTSFSVELLCIRLFMVLKVLGLSVFALAVLTNFYFLCHGGETMAFQGEFSLHM